MATFDILLDKNQELVATPGGDFSTGDAANNLIKYIVLATPGSYKLYPEVGAGIYNYVNANASPAQIERSIRQQLEYDVFKRPKIDVSAFPTIKIDRIQLDLT